MGHLTRLSEPLEISRWRPFFKIAHEQLSDGGLFGDTSMQIAMTHE